MASLDKAASSPEVAVVRRSPLKLQILLVMAALFVAVVIIQLPPRAIPAKPPTPAPFDMLAFLDKRVAVQENEKDVRCWSSFNKLQMFITQSEISQEAKVERIEQHMRLIDSIWADARKKTGQEPLIGLDAVKAVLNERYPHVDTSEGTKFYLGQAARPIVVMVESLKDYSDTIEPWRLLQTWAALQTGDKGTLDGSPPFDEHALQELYRFFRSYDLAMLQHARRIAGDNKLSSIDKASITAAFDAAVVPKRP